MNEVYSKAVASIESTDDSKFGPNGGFTAVLSTPSMDRDGDRLMREEWKEFTQERYPLDIDHGMTVADTVGSFAPYWDGDRMMMDAAFAATAKAQEVRALVTPDPQTGIRHIGSVSVAFMSDKSKKSGEPQRELLNAGIVAIPSNRDAVILASKAASALRDAFSDSTDGEVPAEVKEAVLEAVGEVGGIKVNVVPTLDVLALDGIVTSLGEAFAKSLSAAVDNAFIEVLTKAAVVPGGGGDAALVAAIHDASVHLGALCPVIEVPVDPDSGASSGANKSVEDTETENLDAFTKGLEEILPDDSPAVAAAASDEEPAPADEAAEDAGAQRKRALSLMQMRLRNN